MISLILLIIVLFLVLIYLIYCNTRRPKNFPPGPRWLPVVGCAPEFRKLTSDLGYQHLALCRLSCQYKSPIVGLKLGGQLAIAVSGYDAVKQVFTREEFEGRPDNFFIRLRNMGTRKGITFTDGPHWQEQRSFAVRHLKSLGYGKGTMENSILDQVDQEMKKLDFKVGTSMCPDFGPAVMSVLWALIAGTQFSDDDPSLNKILSLMHKRAQVFDMSGGMLAQFPWLRFIVPQATGYTLINTINKQLHTFFLELIQSHRSNFCKNDEPRDLIDSYLREMEVNKELPDSSFTDDQLVMVCMDMFIAGATTTSDTLSFILLYLSRYPDVQKLVLKEIDENLGGNQMPSLADQERLPYLCAVILEVLRMCAVAPVIPRRLLKETEINGYTIPKHVMVLINTWSVNNDAEYWVDPENFRPERFLSQDGKFKRDERVIPFGLGRRRCLGETLARGFLFLFTTRFFQKYNIYSNDTSPPPPPVPGMILSCPPFQIMLESRSLIK